MINITLGLRLIFTEINGGGFNHRNVDVEVLGIWMTLTFLYTSDIKRLYDIFYLLIGLLMISVHTKIRNYMGEIPYEKALKRYGSTNKAILVRQGVRGWITSHVRAMCAVSLPSQPGLACLLIVANLNRNRIQPDECIEPTICMRLIETLIYCWIDTVNSVRVLHCELNTVAIWCASIKIDL